MHVALYSFNAINKTEISLKEGEEVHYVKPINNDWVEIRKPHTNVYGKVPANYIVEKGDYREQKFFFDTSRREAEAMLANGKYKKGAFLIRKSEKFPANFVLSIKDKSKSIMAKNEIVYVIKHYMLKRNGKRVYLHKDKILDNICQFVDYYSKNYVKVDRHLILTSPCIREKPPVFRDWEIPRHSVQLIEEIGSGNFGSVHKGVLNRNVEIAVKQLKPNSMSIEDFLREAETMKDVRHDKIVTLFGVCTDKNEKEPILIIQEFMVNGSLEKFLRNNKKTLKLDDHTYIAKQIASGMEYLEMKKLVHRDLAARNVLVGEDLICKICDFGLARPLHDYMYLAQKKDAPKPIKWMAPESILRDEFGVKSDVWSYGITLMEVFTNGITPYSGMTNEAVIEKVINGTHRMKNRHNIPQNIYNEITKCWKVNPEERPSFESLRLYFDQFSFEEYLAINDEVSTPNRRRCSIL